MTKRPAFIALNYLLTHVAFRSDDSTDRTPLPLLRDIRRAIKVASYPERMGANLSGATAITQKQIADSARVDRSTVSLALRNDTRIPLATRDRIRAIAQRLGYRPNPLVSVLMARVRPRYAGHRGTLAYLHTVPEGSVTLRDNIHRNFLSGAKRRAMELSYSLDEFFLSPELKPHRLSSMWFARRIAGVVIEHSPGPLCPNRCLPIDLRSVASAAVGVPLAHPAIHYVANDQYMRAVLAAREVFALGYRRPGLVAVEKLDSAMAHRCSAGFWAVQNYIAGIESVPICRLRDGDELALRTWIKRHRPDVIMATKNSILGMMRSAGLRVPHNFGWVHLDWVPESAPAAGVYGNSEHTGAAAVELVISQLQRGEIGLPPRPMSHLVSGTWVPGTSVRNVGQPLNFDTAFFAQPGV